MFGDFLYTTDAALADIGNVDTRSVFPLGSLALKVADNNSPLPRDRVYYRFNYFKDAIRSEQQFEAGGLVDPVTVYNARPLRQHTIGLEKTFYDGLMSVEVRSAFAARETISTTTDFNLANNDYNLAAGGVGNLFIATKVLLSENESSAWAAGLGVQVPTGRDAFVLVGTQDDPNRTLVADILNESVHLHPYVAKLSTPNQRWFSQMFFSMDIPVSRNTVVFTEFDNPPVSQQVTPPTLFNIDLSTGYWLFQDRCRSCVTGMAALVELHSSTTLGDPEVASDFRSNGVFDEITGAGHGSFSGNGFGVLNFTTGVHLLLGDQTNLRVGGVFPLSGDRFFENELSVQCNRRF